MEDALTEKVNLTIDLTGFWPKEETVGEEKKIIDCPGGQTVTVAKSPALKDGLAILINELEKERLHYDGYAKSNNEALAEGGKLAAWAFKKSIEGIKEAIEKCG